MTKKPLFLAVATLSLLIIAVVFWFTKNQALAPLVHEVPSASVDTPTVETPSSEPIDISDWKTYRNEGYGFELKLPSEWSAEETITPSVFYLKSKNFSPVPLIIDYPNKTFYSQGEIEVNIIDNLENFSIEKKYRRFGDIFAIYVDNPNLKPDQMIVGGKDLWIFKTHKRTSSISENNYTTKILKIKNKILHFDYISQGAPDPRIERILEEVVRSVSDI